MMEKRMDEIYSSNKSDREKVMEIMKLESDSDWVIRLTDCFVFKAIPVIVLIATVSLIVHLLSK